MRKREISSSAASDQRIGLRSDSANLSRGRAKVAPSILAIALILTALALGTGCSQDRFEIKQDVQGRTVRLDKRTGEVSVLQGQEMNRVLSPEEVEAKRANDEEQSQREQQEERAKLATLAEMKNWGPVNGTGFGKGVTFELATKWEPGQDGGKMYFKLVGRPAWAIRKAQRTSKAWAPAITILLQDSDGFVRKSVVVPLFTMSDIVGPDGKPMQVEYQGTETYQRDEYAKIGGWNISWTL